MTYSLRPYAYCIAVLAATVLSTQSSAQSTYTWNSNAAAGLWFNPANWTGGPAGTFPGTTGAAGSGNAGDVAQFNPTNTSQAGIPFAAGATTLQLGAINFQSNTNLAVGNSGTTNGTIRLNGANLNGVAGTLAAVGNTGADLTIANNAFGLGGTTGLQLGIAQGVFNVFGNDQPVSGVRNLTIGTVISEVAGTPSGFTVQGGGNVSLTAANTFTGVVTVGTATSDGRLTISNGTALGTTAGKTIVNAGGAPFLNNAGTVAENIDFTGNGFVADTLLFGAIRISNNNTTLSGTLTLTGNSQLFVQGSTTTLSGTLTESPAASARQFDLIGLGTLQINNPVAYTGNTTVQGTVYNLANLGTFLNTAAAPNFLVSGGGTLRLSNTTGANNLGNRLADTIPINLINGTFNFNSSADAATSYAETVGPLSVQSYLNTVSTVQAATGQTSTLTFASITRTNNGSVNFVGAGLGADARNQVLFTAAPVPVNGMIAPWAVYNVTAGAVGTAGTAGSQVNPTGDFASYGATGIVPMTNVVTSQDGTGWAATSNIKLTFLDGGFAQTGNVPQINSLTVLTTSDTPGTTWGNFLLLNDGSGLNTNNLRITTGGVLITGPHNVTIAAFTNLSSGTSEFIWNVQNGTTTVDASITDGATATGLTKVGNGILALGNNNTFSGPIIVNAGNNGGGLQITSLGAFGNLSVARTVTLKAGTGGGNGSTLNFPIGGSQAGLTLPANVTINMEGFLSGGAVNNLTAQGITGINARSSIITNGNLTINGPITFLGNNFIQLQQNDANTNTSGTPTQGTVLTINSTLSSTVPATPFTGWVLYRGGGNIVQNGLITLPNATIGTTENSTILTINPPAAGAHSFLGLGITFGVVKLGGTGNNNVIPATSTVFLGQNANANTGSFWLNGNNQTITQLGIQAGSTGTLSANIVQNGAGTASTLTFNGNAIPSVFDGTVQDGGGAPLNLNLTAGSLTLTGPNTFTGVTTVNNATLGVSSVSNAGAASALGSAAVASTNLVFGTGTLAYTGVSATTSNRGFTINAGGATFNVTSPGGNAGFGGAAVGAGSLTKVGPGTLILSGADTYAGTTTINGGVVRANGTLSTPVVLNNVGSTLMGSGSVAGNITVNPNTALSPGNGAIGTLTNSLATSVTTWSPGGVMTVEYDSAGAPTFTSGTTVDFYTSTGTLSMPGDFTTNKFVINLRRVAGGSTTAGTATIATFGTAPAVSATNFAFTGQFQGSPTIQIVGNSLQINFTPLPPPPAQLNWQATATTLWSDPSNWDGPIPQNSIPQPGTVATFSLATATQFNTNNDLVGLTVDGIRVSGTAPAAFSIGGNPFTIGTATGIDMSAAPANLTVSASITLGVNQSWTVATGRNLLMTGTIDGSGTLTKAGAGTVQVNNALSSFSGGTVVTAGVLEVTQTAAANLVIPPAGLSQLGTGPITINGGELRLTALNPATTSVNNAATGRLVTFGANGGILTANKSVSGVFPIVTNSAATQPAIIRSTIANMDIWANGNAIQINSGNLGGNTGPVRYEMLNGAATVLNGGQTITPPVTFSGMDNGSPAANRAGVAVNGNIANTTLGRFGATNATMIFTNGLHFRNALQFTEFGGTAIIDADITLDTMPNGTFASFSGRGTGTAGAFSVLQLGNATVNNRTITIQNNATMILDSRVRQGAPDAAQNSGGELVNSRVIIQGGGTLEFAQTFTTSTGENAVGFHQINGAIQGQGNDTADGRLLLNLPNRSTNAPVTNLGGVNWTTGAAIEMAGTGTGGLRLESQLNATTNPNPNQSILDFATAARIGAISATGTGTLTYAPSVNGLTLNLAPAAASTVQLGVASSGAGPVTVTLGSAANDLQRWGGLVIKGSSGGGSTIVNLATNQTFPSVTLNGGTFAVPTGITLTAPVTVNGGTLGGTGTVAGAVTVNSGGTINPGSSPGILTVTSATFSAGSNFAVELNGNTPGNGATNHDQLVITGTGAALSLGGNAVLAGTFGYTPANTDKLYIISLTNATSTVGGTFNNIPQNGSVVIGAVGNQFSAQVSYVGDTTTGLTTGGNDVVLFNFTPVPEPVTVLGLAAAGLAGAGWVRRRYART